MKNIKKVIALALAIALGIFALAACSNNGNDNSNSVSNAGETQASGELKTVRIAGVQANLNESAGVALAQGFIEEELAKVGYKAEFSAFAQAGPAINEAFASEVIDLAIYADFPGIVAKSNGIDVRIIGITNAQQNYGVLVQGDSGITSAKNLEGKKIVTGKGTVIQKVFEQWVKAEGADLGKIEQINALADAQTVFSSGEADAIVTAQLGVVLFGSLVPDSKAIYSTATNPDNAAVFTVTGGGKYIDANPEAAKAFLRALHRAYVFAGENPDAVYENLATDQVPAAAIKATYGYDTTFAYFNPEITEEVKARIQSTADFLYDQKLIAEKADLNALIDTSFYDAIKGEF